MAGNGRNVSNKFLVHILTSYSSNKPFVRIKNQKQFGKLNFSIFLKSNFSPIFFVKKNQKNKNFWLWKIGFFDKKTIFWNFCKSVGNRQNEKKIIKIKSLRQININAYPKCYHSVYSWGTMLNWILIIFSNA